MFVLFVLCYTDSNVEKFSIFYSDLKSHLDNLIHVINESSLMNFILCEKKQEKKEKCKQRKKMTGWAAKEDWKKVADEKDKYISK